MQRAIMSSGAFSMRKFRAASSLARSSPMAMPSAFRNSPIYENRLFSEKRRFCRAKPAANAHRRSRQPMYIPLPNRLCATAPTAHANMHQLPPKVGVHPPHYALHSRYTNNNRNWRKSDNHGSVKLTLKLKEI